ncbi:MAG: polysaccharide pyruvyl transferase family protein [Verrucomicrobiales bacterium]|nr:polysaccharide pyruvyl transferase family protein [Verrucomicrobiales bacterium]
MNSRAAIPNILFSTTRSWNCGDDFIAFGVRRLLRDIFPSFNPLAYNRNPDLHHFRIRKHVMTMNLPNEEKDREVDISKYVGDLFWRYDNSWKPAHDTDSLDLAVFAGTPEWFGSMVQPLVEKLADENCAVPVIYLGIGGFEGRDSLTFDKLPGHDQELLKKAALVTVRDSQCEKLLQPVDPLRIPCPALFASPFEKQRLKLGRVALSTQPRDSRQPSPRMDTWDFSQELFRKLIEKMDCEVVCHYHDEIEPMSKLGVPVHFSYDAADYAEIYDQFDLTVTTRVHGAGMCASLGIPAFALQHSTRSETADGFLAEGIDMSSESVDEVMQRIGNFDVAKRSAEILGHKIQVRQKYHNLIQDSLAPALATIGV